MMKKLSLFLLLPLWSISSAWAQSVQLIGEDFATGEVTFFVDISPATSTWVFVEYTNPPTHDPAFMSRATFTSVTFTPSGAGTLLPAEKRGIRLTSSATVTATLNGAPPQFSWCAYAIGVPPNAKLAPDGSYTLLGTPPFTVNGVELADDVTIFGPGTCITSMTDFTYNPGGFAPALEITATASETEVCAGAEVTFTAVASGGTTTAMTYTWDVAGTTPSISSNTYCQVLSTAGKATYTVRVTNVNGCTSTASGTVTVNAVPTVIAVSMAICYNTAATLTANATGETTPATYTWEINGESATTNTKTYIMPARTAPITYTVQVTNTTGCTSTVSNAGTITVYDEFTPGAITTDEKTICSGEDVNTIASSSSASGGNESITYEWRHDGGTISGNTNALDYTPSTYKSTVGAHTFTRWAKDGQCSGFMPSAGSYVLTVNPRPLTPVNASSVVICAGNTATFSASLSASDGVTIDWYDASTSGNRVSEDSWSFTPTAALTATTSYYAAAKIIATGCLSTDRLRVTTTVTPLPDIRVDGVPGSACVGDELNVQASGAFAGGSYCFISYVNDVGSSDCEYDEANTFTVTVPNEGTMMIKVRAMTAAGCVDSVLVHLPDMQGSDCINSAGLIKDSTLTAIVGYPAQTSTAKSAAPAITPNPTYEWRRTGTSSARLANSNTLDYALSNDIAAVNTAGTYYYHRWTFDGAPENSVGLRADGCYTMVVVAPPDNRAGTTTWLKEGSNVIWTAPIRVTPCTDGYTYCSNTQWSYYRWSTANACREQLCPSPWNVPIPSQYVTIDIGWMRSEGWLLNGWSNNGGCPGNGNTADHELWAPNGSDITYIIICDNSRCYLYNNPSGSGQWPLIHCVAIYNY
jgi:hypothetical protein